jgi:hypothetical protein
MNRQMVTRPGHWTSDLNLFWCIGLYASGSTWLFNAGKKIAASCGLGVGLASAFAGTEADLTFPPDTVTAIVKTHELDDAAAALLTEYSRAIWLSVRDPRDCITSLMLYQQCTFDESIEMTKDAAQFCLRIIDHPRTTLFRYEDNFFDAPATLDVLASTFDCRLNAGDKARIYDETRRSAVEALIKTFPDLPSVVGQPEPGHFVDLNTQWHTHHAGRDGEVGRWRRMLSGEQIAVVHRVLGAEMVRLGYDPQG